MSYRGFEEGVTYFINGKYNPSCEAVYITVKGEVRYRLFFQNDGEVVYIEDEAGAPKEHFWVESDVDYFKVLGVIL